MSAPRYSRPIPPSRLPALRSRQSARSQADRVFAQTMVMAIVGMIVMLVIIFRAQNGG